MNALAATRKGWCPGALAPMPAADGLLVRLRLSGRPLSPDEVEAIAECAARFGNCVIEITARANIQLRGIREASLAALQRRLGEVDLLDADVDAEAIRNLVVSPLGGVDPGAVIDVRPTAAAIAARLAENPLLRRLPAKFGFLIDGGGALPLGDVEADIRFEAFQRADGPRFAVALAGGGEWQATCAPGEAAAAAAALAAAFVREAIDCGAPRHMHEVARAEGAALLLRAAGLTPAPAPSLPRRRAAPRDYLGVHSLGDSFYVGAAPPLGRMMADDLRFLAEQARRYGAADIRTTPWRALIVAGPPQWAAERLGAALAASFIVDPGDPRLRVVACSGAPACAHAARAVQVEALRFACVLPAGDGIALHVSGCEKGCAHGRPAPFTLVARQVGYDVIVDGKARDEPSYRALSLLDAPSLLQRLAGSGR